MFCNFVRRFSYPFGKNINPVRYHLKGVNYRSRFLDIFGSKMVYQSPYFALYALEKPYNDRPPEWDVPRIHQKVGITVKWDPRKLFHVKCPPPYDVPYLPVDMKNRYLRVAFFVTKKKCSKVAVERNKCRRKLQYACQSTICLHAHYGFDYGLFVYKAILEANQSDLENYLTKGLKTLNCWVEKPGDEKPINQILMMNRLKKKYKEPVHLPFAVDTLPANTTMNDYFDSLIEHAKVQKKL